MCLANSALMDEKDIPILTGIANYDEWFTVMVRFCMTVCTDVPEYRHVGLSHLMGIPLTMWLSIIGNTMTSFPCAPTQPAMYAATAKRATIAIYTEAKVAYNLVANGHVLCSQVVFRTLSKTIQETFLDPLSNIITVTMAQMLFALKETYGTPGIMEIDMWKNDLMTPFADESVEGFSNHLRRFHKTVARLNLIHEGPGEVSKVQFIYAAAANWKRLRTGMDLYFQQEGSRKTVQRNVRALEAYVREYLINSPTITCAAEGYAGSGGVAHRAEAQHSTDRFDALSAKCESLLSTVQLLLAHGSGSALAALNAPKAEAPHKSPRGAGKPAGYCFHHGYSEAGQKWSHVGMDCDLMTRIRPTEFTDRQRKAKAHTEVQGGNPNKFEPYRSHPSREGRR